MEYSLLLYGDENRWLTASERERTATYAVHADFARRLAEHGHTITGGAELEPTATAKTVRGDDQSIAVTDGPFAETAEQLTGFYLVETDDLDGLMRLAGMLSNGEPVEIRALVPAAKPS